MYSSSYCKQQYININFSYVLFAEYEVEEIPTWLQEEINAESVVENLLT